jgi:hypothetical protein
LRNQLGPRASSRAPTSRSTTKVTRISAPAAKS